jgi:inner membrane protein
VPLYAGAHVAVDGGRPFTHCLLTAVVLAAAAGVAGRFRPVLLGLATGVLLHLLRDLPTGPGVSLFFPVWSKRIEMPYAAYVIVLVVCAVVATLRVTVRRRTPGSAAAQPHATIGP